MVMKKATNVVWSDMNVTKHKRHELNNHRSAVLWFTGLSGAGKSTVANALESRLHSLGLRTYTLDGDNIRHGLNKDLGFDETDRQENIRRIGEVSKLFVDAGVMALTAFISPFREDRDMVRNMLDSGEFVEVYVKCPLDVCEDRDVKGLYKMARSGDIKDFTGIDSPYEEPLLPEVVIDTSMSSIEESVDNILSHLVRHGYIKAAIHKDSDGVYDDFAQQGA